MSHKATNWLSEIKGSDEVEHLGFRLLFYLCDCHNPSHGCFPSQAYLQEKTGLSNGSINTHLKKLEASGIIERVQRMDPTTKRQKSTMYLLGFELPTPWIGGRSDSAECAEPSPDKGQSRLRGLETNPVIEPVTEPVGEGGLFFIVWKAWPFDKLPNNEEAARTLFNKLIPQDQASAAEHAHDHIARLVKLNKYPFMVKYFKERLFAQYVDAPEVDDAGRFRITPQRPEWKLWMGAMRKKHGGKGVEYFVKCGFILVETRWPEGVHPT